MKIKVAVFGRDDLVNRFQDYLKDHNEFEAIPFIYYKASEAVELVDKAFMCEVYLFLENLPFLYAKNKIKKKRLPHVMVAFDEYMILTSFYHLKNRYGQQLNRLSIDIFDETYVKEVLTELNIAGDSIYTYSYRHDEEININQIVDYHKQLWDEGKIDYVLTSLPEVNRRLQEGEIPTYLMEIPKINIDHAIAECKSIAILNMSKSAQIVAGYVRIKNIEKIIEEKGEAHLKELQFKLNQILLKFGHKTYASVLKNNERQYVIFGTRGVLDHITNHYRDFPLIKEIESALNTPVEIGFGLGLTAKQGEDHARLALEACTHNSNSSCYIVNDRGETIGPLGVKKHFDTSQLYQALIHKAKLNNELSYNFIDFVQLRNNEPFSSNDIANYYRVTKRSAERTVNKLLNGNVIKVVGEEKPYVKGRPRKLFQINM
ncbi:hypothetical protein [Ornithinibacillus halotolerans]|uniref:Transcriptional regulator n=1 Tax=Ornithinibacillus halotolerans TaxID=1274357 RepID=A0A916RP29_9BACI|nr:hypothetical protein [Ornithinibacillus halotolerans]GGA63231.1 hypothetical protein GCM10008025_03890 [Ornithinibacillus halotolerans]